MAEKDVNVVLEEIFMTENR